MSHLHHPGRIALLLCVLPTLAYANPAPPCSDQLHAQLFLRSMQAMRTDKVSMKRFETEYLFPFLRCERSRD